MPSPIINSSRLSQELSSTPVSDNADVTNDNTSTLFAFYTMPSTYPAYIITGLEWKNGGTLGGFPYAITYKVDNDPPAGTSMILICYTTIVGQSGTSTIQRVNRLSGGRIVTAGDVIAIGVYDTVSTSKYRVLTGQPSQNQQKVLTAISLSNTGAWVASTSRIYAKVYYKGMS